MRIALLADVHGNLLALEAVLGDLRAYSPDAICNLGDHVSGPLQAAATADLLMSHPITHIRGNHDRHLLDRPAHSMGPSDRAAFHELRASHFDWLRAQPATAEFEGLHLCHGTPVSDNEYLLEHPDGRGPDTQAAIAARLGDRNERIVACGHSHIPRVVRLESGVTLVNPGSVGLPAYNADNHDMECSSPHARYALLDVTSHTVAVTLRAIEYDWESAAALAHQHHRPDWAYALRTGYAWRRKTPSHDKPA